jgi:unspecific monooxygenase
MVSAFLAGHENPQLLLISSLFLLAEHPVRFEFPIQLGY